MTNFNPNRFNPCPKPEPSGKKKKKWLKRTRIKTKRYSILGELDHEFSRFIRRLYADEYGIVQCYTCPHRAHWKDMQNGHFIPRANMGTRVSEDNCRPQCPDCNQGKNGQPVIFAKKLFFELGPKKFQELLKKKYKTVQLKKQEMINLTVYYKQKNSELNG